MTEILGNSKNKDILEEYLKTFNFKNKDVLSSMRILFSNFFMIGES